MRKCEKRLRDIGLFINVLWLSVVAQILKNNNIETSWKRLKYFPVLFSCIDPDEAYCAVTRVCNRTQHIPGFLSTCLVRSMLMGRLLLASSASVELHIGVRLNTDDNNMATDGHAWLSVDKQVMSEADNDFFEAKNYSLLQTLRLE